MTSAACMGDCEKNDRFLCRGYLRSRKQGADVEELFQSPEGVVAWKFN